MSADFNKIIENLISNHIVSKEDLITLLETDSQDNLELLFSSARKIRENIYGKDVYIRGLLEFSNYCKNDCYYCGIRRSNNNVDRYRLTANEILNFCQNGYKIGFRTFVLQSGEDLSFSDTAICQLIKKIKNNFPDCAVTLSIGERGYFSYKAFFDAGADRFLLRHEAANPLLFQKLHPGFQRQDTRLEALYNLREIGFQVGTGFIVGAPYQSLDDIVEDLQFIYKFKPDMIGIGPFVAHPETPFADFENGSVDLTLKLLAILRIMLPSVLLPATTALATLCPDGHIKGILAGANVIMPNLAPPDIRKKYEIYTNKANAKSEASEYIANTNKRLDSIGYRIVVSRGDNISFLKRSPSSDK